MTSPSHAPGGKVCPSCGLSYGTEVQFCTHDGTRLLDAGRVLAGKFVLGPRLGQGSMGVVFEGVQVPMGRKVAVKLLHPDMISNPEMLVRFQREARAASSIDHPGIVTLYDSGRTEDGQAYIAMEFLDGEDLGRVLGRDGRLPPERALALWLEVVEAMAAAHERGVVHRDLKPENIFLARRRGKGGGAEQVKILDFSIARFVRSEDRQTGPNMLMGTLPYMAPEQLQGQEAGPPADVYALGLLLCEMLTGRLPWEREERIDATAMLRLLHPPKTLAEMCPDRPFSAELQRLLERLLARAIDARPADAGAVLRCLQEERVPEAAAARPERAEEPETPAPAPETEPRPEAPPRPHDTALLPQLPRLAQAPDETTVKAPPSSPPTERVRLPEIEETVRRDPTARTAAAALATARTSLPVRIAEPLADTRKVRSIGARLRRAAALGTMLGMGLFFLYYHLRGAPSARTPSPPPALAVPAAQATPAAARPADTTPVPAAQAAEPGPALLHVQFLLHSPRGMRIACGRGPLEPLEPTCPSDGPCRANVHLSAHDRCEASHPGFGARSFDYNGIRKKYRQTGARIRVPVVLGRPAGL